MMVSSPKRNRNEAGRANWYPYYAGYSPQFVRDALHLTIASRESAKVLDPWNGAGTTTQIASELGCEVVGFDLNPAMVVIAKARTLCSRVHSSVSPIAATLVQDVQPCVLKADPLLGWMQPAAAASMRALERKVKTAFVPANVNDYLLDNVGDVSFSDLAAFFYTALFRTFRSLLVRFQASNPTWLRFPPRAQRIRPGHDVILKVFRDQVKHMLECFSPSTSCRLWMDPRVRIETGDSRELRLTDESIDVVVTSPPYCTRIDYAVTTAPELAILGYGYRTDVSVLRRAMLGTSTVPAVVPSVQAEWGDTCIRFLTNVKQHASKASFTYYYKCHVQYFQAYYESLSEISRVVRAGGDVVIVVQDSYYKDVFNDLPKVTIEMGSAFGLRLSDRFDFLTKRSLAGVHPHSRRYRNTFSATESVLCFRREKTAYVS